MNSVSHANARILIVEDESVVALDIQDRLQSLGYQVVARVASGQRAIDLAFEHLPDLILMDIMLKGKMDGITAAETIHAQADIPIVFMTALADAATLERAKKTDLLGYILKPFEERDLLVQVEIALYKHRMERALRESQERYELAVLGSKDGIWDWDLRTGICFFSPRWKRILGCADNQLDSDPQEWFRRVHPDDLDRLQAELTNHIQGQSDEIEIEYRMQACNDNWVWVLTCGLGVRDSSGLAYRLSGSQTDITPLKLAEQRQSDDPLVDLLTRSPNRFLLLDRLGYLRGQSREPFALLYLDVDNFRVVNDRLGYAEGDQLLVAVAERLRGIFAPPHLIARVTGDEFCVLLENTTSIQAAQAADQILEAFKQPLTFPGLQAHDLFHQHRDRGLPAERRIRKYAPAGRNSHVPGQVAG